MIAFGESEREIEMKPQLQAVFRKLRELFTSLDEEDVLRHWTIGDQVNAVLRGEAASYGAGAIWKLVRALKRSKSTLYAHSAAAADWTADEINKLLRRCALRPGPGLTWRHFTVLHVKIPTHAEQLRWIGRAIRNKWSAIQLSRAIDEERFARMPALLRALEKHNDTLLHICSLRRELEEALRSAPTFDAETIELVRQGIQAAERMKAICAANADSLRQRLAADLPRPVALANEPEKDNRGLSKRLENQADAKPSTT
jgi:hypothetical protein